ncbi:MAG: PASTA domain-containing protein [Prevotellaceae bacterium]|jgi:beta-lactam-binding protein with PASTA domain|nr:PASTA domain-containing protein [Prevotellaceae bacterium]
MKRKELKKHWIAFSRKHPWIANFLVAGAACLLLFWAVSIALDIFTRHGQVYEVPDFTNMSLQDAQALAKTHKMELVVTDSVFVSYRPRGTVFRQSPKSGAMVKKNRNIFLTVNSMTPRKVEMPNVTGYSLRQAKTVLAAKNLHVGKLNYVPDIATNNVLQQKYKGATVAPGVEIPVDSYIDLELGISSYGERTIIPQLIGYTFVEAKDALVEASLNSGTVHCDKTITSYADSLFARVYKQVPAFSESNIWTLGLKVDLWITLDESKIKE